MEKCVLHYVELKAPVFTHYLGGHSCMQLSAPYWKSVMDGSHPSITKSSPKLQNAKQHFNLYTPTRQNNSLTSSYGPHRAAQ
jgi:hypothetical protein